MSDKTRPSNANAKTHSNGSYRSVCTRIGIVISDPELLSKKLTTSKFGKSSTETKNARVRKVRRDG